MIALVEEPIDLGALLAAVSDPERGATAVFLGSTRREGDGRPVEALVYEAYDELAVRELQVIAQETESRHDARLAIVHRVGRVAAGEASIAIVASAGHRPAAFAACRFALEAVKARLPVWKQTVFEDGGTQWLDGSAPGATGTPGAARRA